LRNLKARPPTEAALSLWLVLALRHGDQPLIAIYDRLHGVLAFGAEKLGLIAALLNVPPPPLDFGLVAIVH
jgi:hypothetical protein